MYMYMYMYIQYIQNSQEAHDIGNWCSRALFESYKIQFQLILQQKGSLSPRVLPNGTQAISIIYVH